MVRLWACTSRAWYRRCRSSTMAITGSSGSFEPRAPKERWMMRFPWRLVKSSWPGRIDEATDALDNNYETATVVESNVVRGVKFTIAKISFGRRVELMRRVRELARRLEFLEAGKEPGEKMDAAILRAEMDRLYVAWGVQA